MSRRTFCCLMAACCMAQSVSTAAPILPAGDKKPFLRIEAGGPSSFVTSLAFRPDGKTLYEAGFDKIVRVWKLDEEQKTFVLDAGASYRIPIGPGLEGGVINAVALSPDGEWLAVAGLGLVREAAGFREPGKVVPLSAMSREMWEDRGMIYVFNTTKPDVRLLRGHMGPVLSLAFVSDPAASAQAGKASHSPVLISAAREWDRNKSVYNGSVRLWSIAKDRVLELGRLDLPDPENRRPGLSGWRIGPQPKQVRVALAWGDGTFRLYQPGETGTNRLQERPDGKYFNDSVLVLPGSDKGPQRAVTGSFRPDLTGQLQTWQIGADGQIHPAERRELRGERREEDSGRKDNRPAPPVPHPSFLAPRAAALFSSQADGKLDHVAVILRVKTKAGEEYRLRILGLEGKALGAQKGNDLALWKGEGARPTLATAPHGRYLAVAGNTSHELHLYTIADLIERRAGRVSPLILRGGGVEVRCVEFVKKGNNVGLLLSESSKGRAGDPPRGPGKPGDVIFDIGARSLTADLKGWIGDSFDGRTSGLRAALIPGQRDKAGRAGSPVFSIRHPDGREHRIELEAGQTVTDYALVTATRPFYEAPLLAVALNDGYGQPWLHLYNAATGDRLRQLTAHTGTIRAVAFSRDGRLLASAGDDQTVCVWSLTELHKHLGQRGVLAGVGVGLSGADLVVAQLEPFSPARGTLQEGDIITGCVVDGKLERLKSVRDFYEAVSRYKPGQTLTLRIQRPGGRPAAPRGQVRDIRLPVTQGVDEHKPLFSFFSARPRQEGRHQVEERDWIGWSPHGNFDASTRKAERRLGWHLNTGDPATPAEFTSADKYHDEFYHKDLLKHLVARGNLADALRESRQPLAPPRLILGIGDLAQEPRQDEQGHWLVQQPQVALKLAIDDFPPDRIASLDWRLTGIKPDKLPTLSGKFDAGTDGERNATLPPLRRGVYRIQAVLTTQEEVPQTFTQELFLRWQPPAPLIKPEHDKTYLVVERELFIFKATVKAGQKGEAADVKLEHRHMNRIVHTENLLLQEQDLAISKELKLLPGENNLELTVVPRDALAGHQSDETARWQLVVVYKKQTLPPRIVLERIRGLTPAARHWELTPTARQVVDVARVRIEGHIKAEENVTQVEGARGAWKLDKPAQEIPIHEEVELRPGRRTIRYAARTASGQEAQATLHIAYQPRLPEVVLSTRPAQRELYEGKDPTHIEVIGDISGADDSYPFTAVLVVNGQELAEQPCQIDKDKRSLTGRVRLQPGDSRIQVRLRNEWGAVATRGDVQVRYLRPPSHLKLTGPKETKQALIDLSLAVSSATPLRKESLRVLVNGRERRPAKVEITPGPEVGKTEAYSVLLKELPLDPGQNEVRVWLSNTDAACLAPAVAVVTYDKPPPPRPEVVIFEPGSDSPPVTRPSLTVRFQVRSASTLRRLELVREQQTGVPLRLSFDVSKLKPAGKEYTVKVVVRSDSGATPIMQADLSRLEPDANGFLTLDTNLQLAPGANALRVEAVNEGGEQQSTAVISYVPDPVRLEVVQLHWKKALPPLLPSRTDGVFSFPPVPEGRPLLHGRVIWLDEKDPQLKAANRVVVYVNGFLQKPAFLKPTAQAPRQKEFETEIVLDRRQSNHVRIELPLLKQGTGSRCDFVVDCLKPAPVAQRLHLLVVGVDEKDPAQLIRRVFSALQATPKNQEQFTTPAFPRGGHLYGPITGYVDPDLVFRRLWRIRKTIVALRDSPDSANDVVMIYFQGQETVTEKGHFFLTSLSKCNPDLRLSAISCDGLARHLAEISGPKVLLLDVSRPGDRQVLAKARVAGRDRVVDWPEESYVGILRLVWLGRAHTPEEARLLSALEQTMPNVGRLNDLARSVSKRYDLLAPKFPDDLSFVPRLAPGLEHLVVGPR